MTRLALVFLLACGGAEVRPVSVAQPEDSAALAPAPAVGPALIGPAPLGPALIGDDGVLSAYPDGPVTLVGPRTRCLGEIVGGRLQGCELGRIRVVLPGDAIATLLPPQSSEAPALAVDAPLRGGFAGHPLRFTLESEPGDALCPGSPTLIRFTQEESSLGMVSIDAPITRQLGRGVVALLVTPDATFVLLGWGRDHWRLVDLDGETISEARSAHDAECDCCD